MKKSILSILLSFLLGGTLAHGANVVINPGQSIQAAINASSAGDVIYVNDGIYPENLTLDAKDVRIIGQGNARPRVFNLTIRNYANFDKITNLSATETTDHKLIIENVQNANLGNLTVSKGDLVVTNSKLNLRNATLGRDLSVSQATISIRNSQIARNLDANRSVVLLKDSNVTNDVNAHKSNLRLLRSQVTKNVNMHDSQNHLGAATQCVVLQSTIGEKLTTKAAQSFVCYNTIRYGYFEGKVDITGNTFDGRDAPLVGIDLNGTSTTAHIRNNLIQWMGRDHDNGFTEKIIGIRIGGGSKAEITNNVIRGCRDARSAGTNVNCGMGIFVKVDTGTIIKGNVIYDCYDKTTNKTGGNRLVHAPASVNLSYNNLYKSGNVHADLVSGGVTNVSAITGNPQFTNSNNLNFSLKSDSPCINKGPEDARYNDRDGSRNDIGMYGGHSFIPNGRTTNKPIVLSLDVAPIFVPVGGKVTIESTGATVK